jgi:hypothetical protein
MTAIANTQSGITNNVFFSIFMASAKRSKAGPRPPAAGSPALRDNLDSQISQLNPKLNGQWPLAPDSLEPAKRKPKNEIF